jgi:endonuclease/exonuclease/phosphatase (EEP) superfamily protein YafD
MPARTSPTGPGERTVGEGSTVKEMIRGRRLVVLLAVAAVALLALVALPRDEPSPQVPLPTPTPSAPAPTDEPDVPTATPDRSLTLVTANVAFSLGERGARRQVERVAGSGADVLVLQEVRSRPLEEWLPGWEVHRPPPYSSAIAWRSDALRVVEADAAEGFAGPRYGRALPWVLLEEPTGGRYGVVAVHLPHGALRHAVLRGLFRTMTGNLGTLVEELGAEGPVLLGGDWNDRLDREGPGWGAVGSLARMGLATNWGAGSPCADTTTHGGRIDGWGYDPEAVTLVEQRCLSRGRSDHHPVLVTVRPR